MADEKQTGTEAPTSSGMGVGGKVAIVAVLAIAVAGVIWMKSRDKSRTPAPPVDGGKPPVVSTTPNGGGQPPASAIPKLVDLGAGKCIPCKMMAPILEELRQEYAGRLEVVFIDTWLNPEAGKQYGIKLIPTQIFYGADGKELFRHEGFFSKEEILGKWKELGVSLAPAPAPAGGAARP